MQHYINTIYFSYNGMQGHEHQTRYGWLSYATILMGKIQTSGN